MPFLVRLSWCLGILVIQSRRFPHKWDFASVLSYMPSMRPQDKADASEQNPHIVTPEMTGHALDGFHALAREWYRTSFPAPTKPQALGWPVIKSGASTLILSPTGSGKTLTAFMSAIDRLMFEPFPPKDKRYSVIYLSPLKALAVDVERNLRAANDPANPYGTALPWLERPEGRRPMRLAGAHVILVDGALAA